jgi:hypothetical protein
MEGIDMKKPSANKVLATFGVLFIGVIVMLGPMFGYIVIITKHPNLIGSTIMLFAWYYFEIRKFADWCGKKYKEII